MAPAGDVGDADAAVSAGTPSASHACTVAASEKAPCCTATTASVLPPHSRSAAAGDASDAQAAAKTCQQKKAVLDVHKLLRLWPRGSIQMEKPLALRESNPPGDVFHPSSAFFTPPSAYRPDYHSFDVSFTADECSPAAATAAQRRTHTKQAVTSYPTVSRRWLKSSFAFAVALVRHQSSFPRRCLVSLQLLHALLWWTAATVSIACSSKAAVVLALHSSLCTHCCRGRRRAIHAEPTTEHQAGGPASTFHASAETVQTEQTLATDSAGASHVSRASAASADTVTLRTTGAGVASAHPAESTDSTEASSTGAAAGAGTVAPGKNTHKVLIPLCGKGLSVRTEHSRSCSDSSSVLHNNNGRDGDLRNSRRYVCLRQTSTRGDDKSKEGAVIFVCDWKGRAFVGLAATVVLLSGFQVFLMSLWRNEWESIDAALFHMTKWHSHYSRSLLLLSISSCVYSGLLLLCVGLCLLPRFFLSTWVSLFSTSSFSFGEQQQMDGDDDSGQYLSVRSSADVGGTDQSSSSRSSCECCDKDADSRKHWGTSPFQNKRNDRVCNSNRCRPCDAAEGIGSTALCVPPLAVYKQQQMSLAASTSCRTSDAAVVSRAPPLSDRKIQPCFYDHGSYNSTAAASAAAAQDDYCARASSLVPPDMGVALSPPSSSAFQERLQGSSCCSYAVLRRACSGEVYVYSSATASPPCPPAMHPARSFAPELPFRAAAAAVPLPATEEALATAGIVAKTAATPMVTFSSQPSSVIVSQHTRNAATSVSAVVSGALPASSADALAVPRSTPAVHFDATEEVAAPYHTVDPAGFVDLKTRPTPSKGKKDGAACIPIGHAVLRPSGVHMLVLLAVLFVQSNVYIWTLYFGIELYRYVYFFFQFYAPFIYAAMLPILTLLLAAVILAPFICRCPLLHTLICSTQEAPYAALADLPSPGGSNKSTEAASIFLSPDELLSPASKVAVSPLTRCSGVRTFSPADHKGDDCCLLPPPSHCRTAPRLPPHFCHVPVDNSEGYNNDNAARPFGPSEASKSLLSIQTRCRGVPLCEGRNGGAGTATCTPRGSGYSAAHDSPRLGHAEAGCTPDAVAQRFAVQPRASGGFSHPGAQCSALKPLTSGPRRKYGLGLSTATTVWGKPHPQRQEQQHKQEWSQRQEQDQRLLSAAENFEKTTQPQHCQQSEPYFFLKGAETQKVTKAISLLPRLWWFILLMVLWLVLLILPFLPFFVASTCLVAPHRQQDQGVLQDDARLFRSHSSASSGRFVNPVEREVTGDRKSRTGEKEALRTTKPVPQTVAKPFFTRSEQEKKTTDSILVTKSAVVKPSPSLSALETTSTGQDLHVLAEGNSRGKIQVDTTDSTSPAPACKSEDLDYAHASGAAPHVVAVPPAAQSDEAGQLTRRHSRGATEAEEVERFALMARELLAAEAPVRAAAQPPKASATMRSTVEALPGVSTPIILLPDAGAEAGGSTREMEAADTEGRQRSVGSIVEDTKAAVTATAPEDSATATEAATHSSVQAALLTEEIARLSSSVAIPKETVPTRELAASIHQARRLGALTAKLATVGGPAIPQEAATGGVRIEAPHSDAGVAPSKDVSAEEPDGMVRGKNRDSLSVGNAVENTKETRASYLTGKTQRFDTKERPVEGPRDGRGWFVEEKTFHHMPTVAPVSLPPGHYRASPLHRVEPRILHRPSLLQSNFASRRHVVDIMISSFQRHHGDTISLPLETSLGPPAVAAAPHSSDTLRVAAGARLFSVISSATAGVNAAPSRPLPSSALCPPFPHPCNSLIAGGVPTHAMRDGPEAARQLSNTAATEYKTSTPGVHSPSEGYEHAAQDHQQRSVSATLAAEGRDEENEHRTDAVSLAAKANHKRRLQTLEEAGDGCGVDEDNADKAPLAEVRGRNLPMLQCEHRDKQTAADVASMRHKGATCVAGSHASVREDKDMTRGAASEEGLERRRERERGEGTAADEINVRVVNCYSDKVGEATHSKSSHINDKEGKLKNTSSLLLNKRCSDKGEDPSSNTETAEEEGSLLWQVLPTSVWCAATNVATWLSTQWEDVHRDPVTLLPPKPRLIGHRGLPAFRPENTETSFVAASDACDALEADVNTSLDGVLTVIHDRTFRRTTDVATQFPEKADDYIYSFDWSSIQKLDAGKWWLDADPFGHRASVDSATQSVIATQKIPSFESLLKHLVKTKKKLIYDLNCPTCKQSAWGCDGRCLDLVKDLLHKTKSSQYILWMQGQEEEVKREFPGITIVRSVSKGQFDVDAENAKDPSSRAEMLNSDWRYTPAASVRNWVDAGFWANIYVVTAPWVLSYFWCAGANSVTTDDCASTRSLRVPVYVYTLSAFRLFAAILDTVCILLIFLCLLLRLYSEKRSSRRNCFITAAPAFPGNQEEAEITDFESRREEDIACTEPLEHSDDRKLPVSTRDGSNNMSSASVTAESAVTLGCACARMRQRSCSSCSL